MIKELLISSIQFLAHDIEVLSEAIYFESRSEGRCQYYVAGVIKNRVLHDRWPNKVEDVIYQPHQFSYVDEVDNLTMHNEEARRYAEQIAYSVLATDDMPLFNNIVYFHHKNSTPYWADEMEHQVTCGQHLFYSEEQ